jgi:hypothetical protein
MTLWSQPAKAIYLANRHPRLSREVFGERWLRHSRIGEVVADLRLQSSVSSLRYCLTVDPAGILDAATNEHDGVALLALRSVLSIPTFHNVLTENDVAYADELRTFERPVEDVTMLTASDLLVEGSETDVVVLELARRRADVGPEEYVRQRDEERARQLEYVGLVEHGLRRWVRNVLVAPAPRGFGYDAVNELWFDSIDHVAAAASSLEGLFEALGSHTERRASTILVTTVIHRLGRDRP